MISKFSGFAWIAAVLPLCGQAQPALVDVLQVHSRNSPFGQHMTASPNRRFFVVYAETAEESPSGLINSLAVVEAGGAVHSPASGAPALTATVGDDGSAWAAGYASLADQAKSNEMVTKLDATGAVALSFAIDASPAGMALDAQGNLLLSGSAAPGSTFAGVPADAAGPVAFLAKLDASTGATLWVKTLGGTRCANGSCGVYGGPHTSAGPTAVMANGDIWVAGFTDVADLPVTPDALAGQPPGFGSWLARFSGNGTLRYASYLLGRNDTPIGITLGGDSSIYLASRAAGATSYSTIFAKVDAAGAKVEYSTNEPWNIDRLDLGVDANGRLMGAYGYFVTNGFWLNPDGSLGGAVAFPQYLVALVTAAGDSIYGLMGGQPYSIDPLAQAFFYRWKLPDGPGPTVNWAVSSEGTVLIERVAAGELVSFYGGGLGPQPGVATAFDGNGLLPVNVVGTQVLFDGKPAPLLYASATQVNAIVPYAVASRGTTTVQVCAPACAAAFDLRVVPSHPNVFTMADSPVGTRAIAFNSDGTLNSSASPAAAGSVVTIFLTGVGVATTPLVDGMAGTPLRGVPALPVAVSVRGVQGDVLYAGSLAGTVNGVVQVNLRVPPIGGSGVSKEMLTVTVGDSAAQAEIYLAR